MMCQGHVRICAISFLSSAAILGGLTVSPAQDYPTRPVTLVVPQAAGGPGDVVARIMSETMRASLSQPVIIENVVGAGGSIGVGRVARAAPDGYTIVLGNWGSHVVNGITYDLKYNPIDSFTPISLIAENYQLLVGRKSLPPRDLATLIEWLRVNRDKATQGISGWGGSVSRVRIVLAKNDRGAVSDCPVSRSSAGDARLDRRTSRSLNRQHGELTASSTVTAD